MASFYIDGNKLRIYEVPDTSTFTVDGNGYRIYTPTGSPDPLVRFDVQRDLWSRFQDWVEVNSWALLAFSRSGGGFRGFDTLGNAIYQTNDYRLLTSVGWKIVLANYPHEVVFRGNLFTDDGASLFDNARITSPGVMARLEGFDSLQPYLVAGGSGGGGSGTVTAMAPNVITAATLASDAIAEIQAGLATGTDVSETQDTLAALIAAGGTGGSGGSVIRL